MTPEGKMLHALFEAMLTHDAGRPDLIHHFAKVHAFAKHIGEAEELDMRTQFILEAAAIAHDVGILPSEARYGDSSGSHQEELGPDEARPMLTAIGFDSAAADRICFLIAHHHTTQGIDGHDWQILLEADFLVNMIENALAPSAIDAVRDRLFRTEAGLAMLERIRPKAD